MAMAPIIRGCALTGVAGVGGATAAAGGAAAAGVGGAAAAAAAFLGPACARIHTRRAVSGGQSLGRGAGVFGDDTERIGRADTTLVHLCAVCPTPAWHLFGCGRTMQTRNLVVS